MKRKTRSARRTQQHHNSQERRRVQQLVNLLLLAIPEMRIGQGADPGEDDGGVLFGGFGEKLQRSCFACVSGGGVSMVAVYKCGRGG
jgi:hypothetical protein